MSDKSKKSAQAIDRPFPPAVLAKAKKIAGQYQVILACEDGHWYGRGLELPSVHGDCKTVQQCVEDTREAFVGWIAYLLEEGQRPPTPAREAACTAQVNIRMTTEEKALLETTAKRKGFTGLSDFILRRRDGPGQVTPSRKSRRSKEALSLRRKRLLCRRHRCPLAKPQAAMHAIPGLTSGAHFLFRLLPISRPGDRLFPQDPIGSQEPDVQLTGRGERLPRQL